MTRQEWLAAVGENIAFARGERGMKSVDLAKRLGLTKQAVSMWEHGHAQPTLMHLFDIAQALGVDPADLVRVEV